MHKQNIWFINHHALTPDMSGGTRHYDFAKEFVKRGHKVTIIAASFHYAKFEEMKVYEENQNYLLENIDGIDFIWFKTPAYVGNGVARVKNMLSFMYQLINTIPKLNLDKPDVILGSSVHLFAVYGAYRLSKVYNTKFIMEVRDLWPQTLIDMGISKWHPFIVLLGFLEKYLYKKADIIVTNLPEAHRYIVGLGIDKKNIEWISNGVDLNNVQYKEYLPSKTLTIIYTGAIGIANNLGLLVDVAKKLEARKEIEFQIVGNGPQKMELIKKAKTMHLSNIEFIDAVPKNEISSLLAKADILYFNLKDSPVFKYGISSNKLFDYMAAGRVVIFSASSPNNPIKEAKGGFSIPPESLVDLEKAIEDIYKLSIGERKIMGENNRRYVEKNYSINVLVDKFEQIIKKLKEADV